MFEKCSSDDTLRPLSWAIMSINEPRVGMSLDRKGNTASASTMAFVKGGEKSATTVAILSLYVLVKRYPVRLLLLFVVLRFYLRRYHSPLRSLPGPFLASGSRAWKGISNMFAGEPSVTDVLTPQSVWSTYQGHTEQDHIELHRIYGISEHSASLRSIVERIRRQSHTHRTE